MDDQNLAQAYCHPEGSPERAKALMRAFGRPMGITVYVHWECAERYLRSLETEGRVILPAETKQWTVETLIGRFPDITHCDGCSKPFEMSDEGYVSFWVVSQQNYRLWKEIEAT